jgi:hypothetical protein
VSELTIGRQSLSSGIFIKTMCLCSWMKAQIIVLPKDHQFALPIHAVGSPQGVMTNTAVSIDAAVLMTEIEQEDWAEEVLDDGMVAMLNIQFDNLIAEDESDLSCLLCCLYSEQYTR